MLMKSTAGKMEFQGDARRKVVAAFDGGTVTSDAGGLLLGEMDRSTGLIDEFSGCFTDGRDPDRVTHPLKQLLRQRIFGLCLGYEDLNDHEQMRHDPTLMLLCGQGDTMGQGSEGQGRAALAGKSTLDRLELGGPKPKDSERYLKIGWNEEAIGRFFVKRFLDAHAKEPESITIDFDPTDIELHGEQEERHFNAYYDEYCYLPLYVFCGDFLLMALLRPAYLDAAFEIEALLDPLLAQIRKRWPRVHIMLRGDGAFCREELMGMVERRKAAGEKIDFTLGLPGNSRLLAELEQAMTTASARYERTGQTARVFAEFKYQTLKSWSRARRVVGKAEHNEQGANPRFVVTSLPKKKHPAKKLYEVDYCGRGEAENRIKEQKLGLFAARTSSSSFAANQLRLYFSAVAYTLMNELRRVALAGTELARAQCSTIREKLLKIGARVLCSARRVRLMLASSYPWQALFGTALQNLRMAYISLRC